MALTDERNPGSSRDFPHTDDAPAIEPPGIAVERARARHDDGGKDTSKNKPAPSLLERMRQHPYIVAAIVIVVLLVIVAGLWWMGELGGVLESLGLGRFRGVPKGYILIKDPAEALPLRMTESVPISRQYDEVGLRPRRTVTFSTRRAGSY